MDGGPVFIAGIERSGTSLIYALLASHPSLGMTRRTNLWTYFYKQYGDLSRPENFERCLNVMMQYKRLLVLKPDFELLRYEFWQGEPTYVRLFTLLHQHYAQSLGKPRWGDKSLNTERYANEIFAAYPSAKVIHIIRDPRDRYASALTRWKHMRGKVGAGTAMWQVSVALAKRNVQRYPDRYKIVRYETLATHPQETLREICAFIGEEYTPVMLTMKVAERFRDSGGNSSYREGEPGEISTRSIGRFRKVLSKRDIAFMQALAKRDMALLGYDLEPIHFSFHDSLLFSFADLPANLVRMIAWRIRETIENKKGRALPADRIVPALSTT